MIEEKGENKRAVSIITIVFNGEKDIEETINSVISQKNVDVEYIIVDGDSTDKTLQIIGKYKNKIAKIISEKDDGIYDAVNKGIVIAKNPLVGLIHCGDTYSSGALAKVCKAFEQSNADVIYGDIAIKEESVHACLVNNVIADHRQLCKKMSIFHPSCFVKNTVYKNVSKYNKAYFLAADYDFFLQLFLKDMKFVHVPSVLATFRAGGLSGDNFKLSLKENWIIRKNRLSTGIALSYALSTIFRHYFYSLRKFIIKSIIGEKIYFKVKQYKQNYKKSQ